MAVLKPLLLLATVVAAVVGWSHRGWLTESYRNDGVETVVVVEPLALEIDRVELGPSPYLVERTASATGSWGAPVVDPAPESPVAVAMGGGDAAVGGQVVGPDGPVPGAVVRLERFTSDGSAGAEVVTADDGTFEFLGLAGGRFRLRAHLPGELASDRPEVFVLGAGERSDRAVAVRSADPMPVVDVAAGPLLVGGLGAVGVGLGREQVDDAGRVIVVPAVGRRATISLDGPAELRSAPEVLFDIAGHASLAVACTAPGPVSISVAGDGWIRAVPLGTCELPPPPEPAEGEATGEGGAATPDAGEADG